MKEEPGIILTPLASALDCGSEGLKSSAPSSTKFSSSSDEQEKKHKPVVNHTTTSCRLEECYSIRLHTHTQMDTHNMDKRLVDLPDSK